MVGSVTTQILDVSAVARARRLAKSGAGRALRVGAGVSIRELARAIGVAPSVVWRWERGERYPRADNAVRWVEVLDELGGTT